ncbi:hypothetical protein [Nocardia sp. Marseille-Q1738]
MAKGTALGRTRVSCSRMAMGGSAPVALNSTSPLPGLWGIGKIGRAAITAADPRRFT